jgi:hypothetical protein
VSAAAAFEASADAFPSSESKILAMFYIPTTVQLVPLNHARTWLAPLPAIVAPQVAVLLSVMVRSIPTFGDDGSSANNQVVRLTSDVSRDISSRKRCISRESGSLFGTRVVIASAV